MEDRDDLDALIESSRKSLDTDESVFEDLNKKFNELRRRHRERNVF